MLRERELEEAAALGVGEAADIGEGEALAIGEGEDYMEEQIQELLETSPYCRIDGE